MERPVKERLIGASVLIVAAVIVIPWLLDGNDRVSSKRSELQLPTAGDVQAETRTVILDGTSPGGSSLSGEYPPKSAPARAVPDVAGRAADVPGEAAGLAPVVAESAQQQPADPVTDPTAPTPAFIRPLPAAGSASTGAAAGDAPPALKTGAAWAVQVGSFALQENAERLSDRLKNKGYSAFVMRNVVNGRVRYRVRVGPVAERGQADELAKSLRADRQPARVLSHP